MMKDLRSAVVVLIIKSSSLHHKSQTENVNYLEALTVSKAPRKEYFFRQGCEKKSTVSVVHNMFLTAFVNPCKT